MCDLQKRLMDILTFFNRENQSWGQSYEAFCALGVYVTDKRWAPDFSIVALGVRILFKLTFSPSFLSLKSFE